MFRRIPPVPARAAALVAACTVTLSSLAGAGVGSAETITPTGEPTGATAQAIAAPNLKWQRTLPAIVLESSPKVADLDRNGIRDVVVGAHDNKVHVFQGTDGQNVLGWPRDTGDKVNSTAAIVDTTGDGWSEVFIGSGNDSLIRGHLNSFTREGHPRWQYKAADELNAAASVHAAPAVGDVTGDGVDDVSVGTLGFESIHSVDSRNGASHSALFPFYSDDSVFSSPALLDVTGDGTKEIIIGGDATSGGWVDHQGGIIRAIRADGRGPGHNDRGLFGGLLWQFKINDIIRGGPSIGDIDGDGRPEIVFGSGDYWGGTDSEKVFAIDTNGKLKPGWPKQTDGVTNASPTLADLTGDGVLDVVMGTWESRHGRGKGASVYAWKGDGSTIGGFPIRSEVGAVLNQIVTADLTGDGRQDLVVTGTWGTRAYGSNGAHLFTLGAGNEVGFQNSALITDLEGNGRLDIVVAGGIHRLGQGKVLAYEMPSTTARMGHLGWSQARRDARNTGVVPSLAAARTTNDGCPAGKVPASGFGDVAAGNVHRAAIDCIAWWQVSSGQGTGYGPAGMVHRDQMATFIAKSIERSGKALPASPPDAFDDDEANPHESSINKLAAVGVVSGTGHRKYGAGARVSRDQMASFLIKAYTFRTGKTPTATINYFPDEDGNVHEGNINKAAAAGFTGGSDSGRYQPLAPVARDQMASFLSRLLDRVVVDAGARTP